MSKKRIGIITWHYFPNFGSALQAYALQYSVECLGCDAQIINFRDRKYGNYHPLKVSIQNVLHQTLCCVNNRFAFPFQYFQRKFFKETKPITSEQLLPLITKDFDVVISGSDQIWAPNVLNSVYLLNFVPDNIPRISYAASIGLNSIPEEKISLYKDSISKFRAVSVRETAGKDILERNCGITSEVVLDPTLLVPAKHWQTMEHSVKNVSESKYVFCYFLKADHNYKHAVQQYAEEHGLQIIGFSANKNDIQWMDNYLQRIGPSEFLWLVHHADTVITDSYHGTIFSLLYHKKIITIERFSNTDRICQNSRIYQLKDYFELDQQIVACGKEALTAYPVDYEKFEQTLEELRGKSIQFLKNALRD